MSEQPTRTIIYVEQKTSTAYMVPPAHHAVFRCPLSHDPLGCLNIADLGVKSLLVVDSMVPPAKHMFTLTVSSPGQLKVANKEITKAYWGPRMYMPIPTEDEVWEMRKISFPSLDAAGVERRLRLWGPVPRLVLQSCDIKATPLDSLVTAIRYSERGAHYGDDAHPVHLLMLDHCVGEAPSRDDEADPRNELFYLRGKVDFASNILLQYLSTAMIAEDKFDAQFFIEAAAGIGMYGAARGRLFELLLHGVFAGGVEFPCRELRDTAASAASGAAAAGAATGGAGTGEAVSTPSKIPISKTTEGRWSTLAQLAALANERKHDVLIPTDRRSAGLDAVVWDASRSSLRWWTSQWAAVKAFMLEGLRLQQLHLAGSQIQVGLSAEASHGSWRSDTTGRCRSTGTSMDG